MSAKHSLIPCDRDKHICTNVFKRQLLVFNESKRFTCLAEPLKK